MSKAINYLRPRKANEKIVIMMIVTIIIITVMAKELPKKQKKNIGLEEETHGSKAREAMNAKVQHDQN